MSRFAVTAYTVSVEVMSENIIHNENSCYERRADWKNKDSARATGTCCSRMKYKIANPIKSYKIGLTDGEICSIIMKLT